MIARILGRYVSSTAVAAVIFSLCLVTVSSAAPVLLPQVLASAEPDECFYAIGNERNTWPYDPSTDRCPGGTEKTNYQYLWGLTESGATLWFTTAANPLCWGGAFYGMFDEPVRNGLYACEFGDSQYDLTTVDTREDWRPPQIFMYNTTTIALTERFPGDEAGLALLNTTLGLRSATTFQGIVFLAGPDLYAVSVNFFAFDGVTGEYLGSHRATSFRNIRKWLTVNGNLYFAVQNSDASGGVVRWTGNRENLWQFQTVGTLGSEGTELVYHDGRIFAATWPQVLRDNPVQAGIYMSPVVPANGLTGDHASRWRRVFSFGDYEPDPVTADTYAAGAMASYGGYLYFSTLHNVLGLPVTRHIEMYGEPATQAGLRQIEQNTRRATSIFRARLATGAGLFARFHPTFQVELLYGEDAMPVFRSNVGPNGVWQLTPNNLGQSPLFGRSGFGNPWAAYAWSAAVLNGRLYVGLLDASSLQLDSLSDLDVPPATGNPYGADVWRFDSPDEPAAAENLDGFGNGVTWGIRNLISDGDVIYAGTAGGFNLVTDPTDEYPESGWQLLRLFDVSH